MDLIDICGSVDLLESRAERLLGSRHLRASNSSGNAEREAFALSLSLALVRIERATAELISGGEHGRRLVRWDVRWWWGWYPLSRHGVLFRCGACEASVWWAKQIGNCL